MNPWKAIGWIVLVLLVLSLTFCGFVCSQVAQNVSEGSDPTSAPIGTHEAKVVSLECQTNPRRDRASITIQNSGTTEIPFAKAFVEFVDTQGNVDSAQDSYFSPSSIPSGATASADVYSSQGGSYSCRLAAIQDGDGNRVDAN